MKKLLTITATVEVESTREYPVNTFDDCLDDYDNIDRPLNGLKDVGWNVQFVSLEPLSKRKK